MSGPYCCCSLGPPCRLAACAPVLERFLLGKLDLAAWQALSQTCRVFHALSLTEQVDSSLRTLVQVPVQYLPPAAAPLPHALVLKATRAQAELPHLANQDQLRAELRAEASFTAAVRSGQTPAVAKRACFSDGSLGGEARCLDYSYSQLSPAGNAAVLAWTDASQRSGTVLAHEQTGEDTWLVPETGASTGPAGRWSIPALSFSSRGRWLGNLSHATGGVRAQLYDIAERHWRSELLIDPNYAFVKRQPTVFTECERMAAATYATADAALQPVYVLAVWGCSQRFVLQLPLLGQTHACGWPPGSTSLLIWGDCHLARVDLDINALPSSEPLQLRWVPVPTQLLADTTVCLAFSPCTPVAVTVHCKESAGPAGTVVELALHSTADLRQLGSVSFAVPALPDKTQGELCASVAASAHVAASFDAAPATAVATHVYAVSSSGVLERRLFGMKSMAMPCFSPGDGKFLAGSLQRWRVVVLDARSGSPLATWPGVPSRRVLTALSWAGRRLHVMAGERVDEEQNLVFACLQF